MNKQKTGAQTQRCPYEQALMSITACCDSAQVRPGVT